MCGRGIIPIPLLPLLIILCIIPVYTFATNISGIGGKPAYPRDDNPRSSSIFVHHIDAGKSVSDGVLVVNNASEEKEIELYSTNSARSSGGSFTCAQKLNQKKGSGAWITLSKDTVPVGPKGHTIVDFTITVPEGTVPGEYNSCIVVEGKKSPEKKEGISLSVRTGIRTVITVSGAITRKLENPALSLEKKEDGGIRIKTSVENVGNVSVDTNIDAGIRDIFGNIISNSEGKFPVLREDKKELVFNFKKMFWGGKYTAYAEYSYESGITSLGEGTGDLDKTLSPNPIVFYAMPDTNALIIYGAGLVTLILIFIFILPRKKKRGKGKYLVYTVKRGETIQDVADQVNVPWKKITKLNNIKAPYHMQEGIKLKVKKKKK